MLPELLKVYVLRIHLSHTFQTGFFSKTLHYNLEAYLGFCMWGYYEPHLQLYLLQEAEIRLQIIELQY